MRTHLLFLFLLCCLSVARASDKPKKPTDSSCSYYCSANGKYYCVETSASCDIGHAYVKESGTTAAPVLVILNLHSSSGSCKIYEGSLTISTGLIMVIDVQTCDCGSHLTTHIFYTGPQS